MNEHESTKFFALVRVASAARVAAVFIESHKAALIGNECTGDQYERAIKPLFVALNHAAAIPSPEPPITEEASKAYLAAIES